MFLLFQDMQDEPLEYEDIRRFSPGVSPASYYYFEEPLYAADYETMEDDILVAEMPQEITQRCSVLGRAKSGMHRCPISQCEF